MIVLCCLLFLFLTVLPFWGGIRELIQKKDAAPLHIDMNYTKNPRYFAVSFRKILTAALPQHEPAAGLFSCTLSKPETVEIVETALINQGQTQAHVLFAKTSLVSGKQATFLKEIYVKERAIIGEGNQLRSLACDGDIRVLQGTSFTRWLDATGNIKVAPLCNLGLSATCTQQLSLAQHCRFKRLYGNPVTTAIPKKAVETPESSSLPFQEAAFTLPAKPATANQTRLQRDERLTFGSDAAVAGNQSHLGNIIALKTLFLGDGAIIHGDVKTHGSLKTGTQITITGNVFAEGDIHLGPEARIYGTVFSQGRVVCERGTIVGSSAGIKSIVAKKGIEFGAGIKVYGYVMTEGEGVVW